MALNYHHRNGCSIISVLVLILVATTCTAQEYYLEKTVDSIKEGEGSIRITVLRTTTTGAASVRLRMSQNTLIDSASIDDYASSDILVQFADGSASEEEFVNIVDDAIYEGITGERFLVTLAIVDGTGTPGSVRSGAENLIVTIVDNDSQYYIDSDSDLRVNEDALKAVITIKRIGDLSTAGSVSFSTEENFNTAVENEDYERKNNQLISFGQTVDEQEVDVVIINDEVAESQIEENFDVVLSNPTNGELGSPFRSTVTIVNDDGVYTFSQSTYVVGESDNSVRVCVERTTENTLQQRIVEVTTTAISNSATSTATSNGDYIPLTSGTGRLVFGVGDDEKCLDITILPDSNVEPSEIFTVELSEVQGELGTPSTATVTITDDDATFSFQTASALILEGSGFLRVNVIRQGYLQGATSVRVRSSPGTAYSPADYSNVNQIVPFTTSFSTSSQTQTFDVIITNDDVYEPSEHFYLDLDLVSFDGGTLIAPSRMTVTIQDNDAAPLPIPQPPAPAPGQPAPAPGPGSDLNNADLIAIILGSVGGFLLLLAVLLCCCCMVARRRSQQLPVKPLVPLQQPIFLNTPQINGPVLLNDSPNVFGNDNSLSLQQYNDNYAF